MSQPHRQPHQETLPLHNRRAFLRLAAAAGLAPAFASQGFAAEPKTGSDVPFAPPASGTTRPILPLVKFPEKRELILLTDRPPNLESPISYFKDDITPNDAFFVRWHLGVIPTRIDTATFRLKVGGHVDHELNLSLDDLKKNFQPASVIAVNQCSGNSRSLFEPRVPGGQWGNGAVGNAKWTGVRLSDLLAKAGMKKGAVDVTFGGLDKSPMPTVAPFVKSLPVNEPKVGEVIVAYAMNDQPLPMLNGFPLRLVVPGWYATYWVKALNEINVTDEPFKGFWMAKAYRIPTTPGVQETPDNLAKDTVPISAMTCRSIFVTPENDQRLKANEATEIQGLAWDSGKGITKVEVSVDAGATWSDAALDKELGKYAWRRFRHKWTPTAGKHTLMARATNAAGETQQIKQWNRSGYARNVIEAVMVTAG